MMKPTDKSFSLLKGFLSVSVKLALTNKCSLDFSQVMESHVSMLNLWLELPDMDISVESKYMICIIGSSFEMTYDQESMFITWKFICMLELGQARQDL